MVAELDSVLGMKKTHNISTNYSQTLNRTKEDRIQGTTGMNRLYSKREAIRARLAAKKNIMGNIGR